MTYRTKAFVMACAALLAAGVLGYWSYDKHRKQALRSGVATILLDVSPRMREALTLEISLPPEGRLGTGNQLDQHAAANHSRLSLSENMEALRKHMQFDNRTGARVQEAVAAREKVDKDHRDYRISADAFNTVLGTLSAAQTKVEPHIDAAQLCDIKLISDVRDQTLKAVSEAAAEIEKIKQLEGHR
jgi:hypothetical protein